MINMIEVKATISEKDYDMLRKFQKIKPKSKLKVIGWYANLSDKELVLSIEL